MSEIWVKISSSFLIRLWVKFLFTQYSLICGGKAPFTHRRLGRQFMAIHGGMAFRNDPPGNVLEPYSIPKSSGTHPRWSVKTGGKKIDRVHPRLSHRYSPCTDRQHPYYTAVIRRSLSRMLAVCTRWMAARTRMNTVHFNRPWKIKHVWFSGGSPGSPPDHCGWWRSIPRERRCECEWTWFHSNRQEKLIGDFRNVFKLMDIIIIIIIIYIYIAHIAKASRRLKTGVEMTRDKEINYT